MLAWWLNIGGLVISVLGSIFLFCGSARDTPDIPIRETNPMEQYDYYKNKDTVKEVNKVQIRLNLSRIGIALVGIGFIVQLISQVLQYPSRH